MKLSRPVEIFNDKYPLIGPLFWLLSIQYYAVQLIVGAAWAQPYSWLHNTISDLGNTACREYDHRFVCSPLHPLMNGSFIFIGITMMLGSLLIYQEFRKSALSLASFSAMALAGAGSIMVGLFPENTISKLHETGAAFPFVLGNLALLGFAAALNLPRWLRNYTIISGTVALVALPLFLRHGYLGLGIGGMERIVDYPQSIWLMVFGAYMWRSRYQRRKQH